ncbi:MAG: M81 family metallopeptidase [Burkholderiales bacterium]|nr:M81 family metallopeptidase [Burkholderiales bacterium]
MTLRILVAGFQHETNTFAPSTADWAAFNRGDAFPAYRRGAAMLRFMAGVGAPLSGFMTAAAAQQPGWALLPSVWAGASPSAQVTEAAFERIAGEIVSDAQAALADPAHGGLDAIYLDLHGAAVAEHCDDCEGELLRRLRAVVGPDLPIAVSLDLHANVSDAMLALADVMVAYRTYPHVDMEATGARAAQLLAERLKRGSRAPWHALALPFLIPIASQSTMRAPAQHIFSRLAEIDAQLGTSSNFCMAFPAADIAEAAPRIWCSGATADAARAAAEALHALACQPAPWALDILPAQAAVTQALSLCGDANRPVVIADTQDNPGAGGDSNTTGLIHELLAQGAGRRWPGQVVVGLLHDPAAAAQAHEAGAGAWLDITIGSAVPTFTGQPSDAPVAGPWRVVSISDGRCLLKGPMMTGHVAELGACACLEQDGLQVVVMSAKAQLLDREMLRLQGVVPEVMKIIVVKSSNHFRADFAPIASHVLVAKAAGPMAADPADLPWRKLPVALRARIDTTLEGQP